ncbi:SLC13 family permease [Deinococcus peraridilitoris]|uniref:Di-/tricarboxylate transporter n=1 Tax=Deinococcus peraridilitoris (strain DSM 19664 / LMG 22246 / CIP 109416 / KR-200) TaxID=937777 RepID=K9ZZF3_DEIPD|nr:SLC13 family permease [Deinococcus peraridilitoris]AFZ66115.1 di-/tricarboxylate transporter [Deinococcus peraridilitoris DSM 19664]
MTVVLILFVLALFLFATELLPVDVTALLLLAALMISGEITPQQAFAGFGNDTILTLASLFILTRALLRTGVIEAIGQALSRRASNAWGTVRLMLATVAGVSAFTSNTATTAVFLPVMLGLARRAKLPPGRIMMPLAFASILGGTVTVIGTSTNLVVSGILPRYDLPPLGFFELAWVGLPITVLGMLYLFLVAPRLLPANQDAVADRYGLRAYMAELTVNAESPLIGRSLRETGFGRDYGLTVVAVRRGEQTINAPGADFTLAAGDHVVVEGPTERLLAAKSRMGVHVKQEDRLNESLQGADLNEMGLAEALVMPQSPLLGRSLRGSRFRERYGLSVLGLHRRARASDALASTRLQVGDVLLVQGPRDRLNALEGHLTVLADVSEQQRDTKRAPIAVIVFVSAILLSLFTPLPLAVAVVSAVTVLFALRVIAPQEGYNSIEWSVLVLIASMLAFATAFEESGAAKMIAQYVASVTEPLGPYGLLAAFFVLTVLLTQPMSNQAAALVMLPIAIAVAQQLGYSPRPFAIGIAIAASNSFITPLEPASLLVFGPGRYKFLDFVRVGSGLTLLTFVVAMLIIPWRWPF